MELKKGFKQTELGIIPEQWSISKITEIADYVDYRGKTPTKANNGVLLVTAKNIRAGFIDYKISEEFILESVYEQAMSRGKPQIGDVLITTEAPLGMVACVDREDIALAQRVIKYRGHKNVIHNPYLKYFFLSPYFQRKLDEKSIGSTAKGIKGSVLHQLPVAVPEIKEQEAIANALSDADAYIESIGKLIEKKRLIKKGVMHDLLTGKIRLSGFSSKWHQVPLGDLGQWKGGMTPSMQNTDYWQNGTFPWASSGDVKVKRLFNTAQSITELAIKQRTTNVVPMGSILIVMRSGILRKFLPVSMNMVPMAINQDIKAILPMRGVSGDFILHALTAFGDQILATCLKSGTTVESIELGWLKAFEIPLPELKEQQEIANALTALDIEIDGLDACLQKARLLKKGMMQELLAGRIRLV